MTSAFVAIYLAAIVVANLTVAAFGPSVTIINAFWLIGLDLTVRDRLHDGWEGRGLRWRMAALIGAGGLISYVLNANAGQIAIASTVAFTLAATADGIVYWALGRRTVWNDGWPNHGWVAPFSHLERVNGSNIAGAAVDSILFPLIAFGPFPGLWIIVLGQFAAKVGGGFLWSIVPTIWRRLRALPLRRRAA